MSTVNTTIFTNTYNMENHFNTEYEPRDSSRDPIILPDYPIRPDFQFIINSHTRHMVETAYKAISNIEGWIPIRNFNGHSFMFCEDPCIVDIMTKINNEYGDGHSGSSIGFTMRHMEYIAKNGFSRYREFMMESMRNHHNMQSRRVSQPTTQYLHQ